MLYTVGEAAKMIGIAPSAIRYYEKEGLLPQAQRTKSGRRMYCESDLEWLRMIECLKKTDMPLKEIKRYLLLAAEGDGTIAERLALFVARREDVLARIRDLQQTLDVIDYKIWYYETASLRGGLDNMDRISVESVPDHLRGAMLSLKCNR